MIEADDVRGSNSYVEPHLFDASFEALVKVWSFDLVCVIVA
jgi:hypothetical protein